MSRRVKVAIALGLLAVGAAIILRLWRPFPSDKTPEGAYMRIARSVTTGRIEEAFPYLETEAQWASYTVRDMRRAARDTVLAAYPEPQRSELSAAYRVEAEAKDGSDVFAIVADRRGWRSRLRRDLSGAVAIEVEGERATVVTARGTRYPFRRRDNGIWGLTIFTADLLAEAERASRDLAMVKAAAEDYAADRSRNPPAPRAPGAGTSDASQPP